MSGRGEERLNNLAYERTLALHRTAKTAHEADKQRWAAELQDMREQRDQLQLRLDRHRRMVREDACGDTTEDDTFPGCRW
jgi:hypothetical protein